MTHLTDVIEEQSETLEKLINDIRSNPSTDSVHIHKHVTQAMTKAAQTTLDPIRVGMLRQWINEDRIINNPNKQLITNGDIMFWITGDKSHLTKE